MELNPEDYKEPRCLSCTDFYEPGDQRNVTPIPVDRVIDKLDAYLSRNDADGARRHLEYWLSEAREGHDKRGELAVLNELLGLYRKSGMSEQAFGCVRPAEKLIEELGLEDSLTAGTVYLNIATVCEAFGRPKEALKGYCRAREIYESRLKEGDRRLGGLYNNMALACVSIGEYERAKELYGKAADIMCRCENGLPEAAITLLNLANALEAQYGLEEAAQEISECVERAESYLNDSANVRDGNYAFVCEKCAPTFEYYGWFLAAEEFRRRSKEIYERA